jgi:hypothetical protein
MMPVPVRKSEFVSLRDEDRDWNIEVDLGAIGAYGAMPEAPDPRSILFADLQLNPDTMVHARLGAGRAGIYLDRYVKGVGRTSLAGNWANPGDVVHHTGHLRTSNALREYLITAYLDAKGKGHLVNRCVGILVKPLSPNLRRHLAENLSEVEGFDETKPNAWSGDWHLQALTVKDANFSRFSNLVWLASSLDFYRANKDSGTSFTRFVRGLPRDDRAGSSRR